MLEGETNSAYLAAPDFFVRPPQFATLECDSMRAELARARPYPRHFPCSNLVDPTGDAISGLLLRQEIFQEISNHAEK